VTFSRSSWLRRPSQKYQRTNAEELVPTELPPALVTTNVVAPAPLCSKFGFPHFK
jgi:hypothetical protein